MLLAWVIEILVGWPDWIYARVKHPVVWIGGLISSLERRLNQSKSTQQVRYVSGALAGVFVVTTVAGLAAMISAILPNTVWGIFCEALIASSLLASRSLFVHVKAVAKTLGSGDLRAAREAVSHIVGRDPQQLNEPGIARASLESLAENASDGVIAPLFWGALFGLPGLAAYKAINTLDSMIGHRTERYSAYGGFAARLDDAANFIPARITAILIAAASLKPSAFTVPFRDARQHRSLNAGWPEAAMAGALNVRLSGPRTYGDTCVQEPWLNPAAPDPGIAELRHGLTIYIRAMALAAALIGLAILKMFL